MTVTLAEYHGGSKVRTISSDLQLTIRSKRYQRITATTTGLKVKMPAIKRQALPNGYSWRISNGGSNPIEVVDKQEGTISTGLTIDADETATVWILDNSETPGEFEFILESQASTSNPVLSTFPYLFGSNGDPDSVWHYEDPSNGWDQVADAPAPVNVLGSEEAMARRSTAAVYIHEFAFGGGSEAFRMYDPDIHTAGLATTGSRSRPFAAFVHDDESGDRLLGMGQWGAGSEGIELWQSDVSDSHSWTQLANLSESRVVLFAWYEADSAAENCYVFPNTGLGAENPFKLDFSTGVDSNIKAPSRQAQTLFAGFHLPDTDQFIEAMGRITTGPVNSAQVRRYDPDANDWIALNDFPDGPLHSMMAAGVGSRGYIFGGTNEADEGVATTYRYEANEWVARAPHEGGTGFSAYSKFAQAVNS